MENRIPKLNKLTNEEKEELIAQALSTSEGRIALSNDMVEPSRGGLEYNIGAVEPIQRSLEYNAVGRKLLMIDELPQGALARYERDVAAIGNIVSRQKSKDEEILVPTFELVSNLRIDLSDIKARRFNIVDSVSTNAKEAIQKEEDANIFSALILAEQAQRVADDPLPNDKVDSGMTVKSYSCRSNELIPGSLCLNN